MITLAPEAFAALRHVEAVNAGSGDARARAAVAAVLQGAPDRGSGPAHDFAQQMTLDVAALTADQRRAALEELGHGAFGFVQSVYVADMGTRVRLALRQLFGTAPAKPEPEVGELWPAIEHLMRTVARLQALDPVTTELVRLRGASAHNCRLCRSLRDTRALEAGGTEELYRADPTAWSARHQAAIRLVDAMVWSPREVPTDVREHLTDTEVVEVVLDVMRNAGNKVAVALGADAPRVTEGVELYTVGADGEPVYAAG